MWQHRGGALACGEGAPGICFPLLSPFLHHVYPLYLAPRGCGGGQALPPMDCPPGAKGQGHSRLPGLQGGRLHQVTDLEALLGFPGLPGRVTLET